MATGNLESSESNEPEERTPTGWHQFWSKELIAAEKRARQFTKQGNNIVARFLDKRGSEIGAENRDNRLNLFHTNIVTLQSMLYGQKPKIDVSREHQDPDDDIARVASVLYKRMLEADTQVSGEDMATVLKAALQDRLLPGIGAARVRYEMESTASTTPDGNIERIEHEAAPIDYVHWQDLRWGWCRTWADMPWLAFRVYLDKKEATARFGEKVAKELEYKAQLPSDDEKSGGQFDADQKNNVHKAEIWEIWRKADRKVYWFSDGVDLILDAKDDPLALDGFWPMPRPLTANLTTTLFMPTADYILAQDLYNQIDILNSRITNITRAVKVVGLYDKSAEGIRRMLQEGFENDLIPVDNWAMFAEKGGIQGTVQWFPVEEIARTLQTLKQTLGETIELLHQVSGMSDIMRGAATGQYTAASTDQMKAKMGSVRVQALQDEFARFAGDLSALRAEVISKHFTIESIGQQSNAQFLPEPDKDKILPALQLMKSPQIKWRVDIRPESIAMIDYAQLKSERTEFLTAMATYIQSAQAAVKSMPGALPVLMEMLKWGMAGFKGSDYLEGIMDQAIEAAKKAPPQGQDDGKQAEGALKLEIEKLKIQGQQQKAAAEAQKIQLKAQMDMQLLQQKVQGEIAKINADNQADMSIEQTDARNELVKIQAKLAADMQTIEANLAADLQVEEAQSTMAIAEEQVSHRNTMTQMAAQPRNNGE